MLKSFSRMQRYELLDGGLCELDESFVPAGSRQPLFDALRAEIPWESRAIRVFGREVMQPRLVAWVGDADAVYTYSGTRHVPLPWTPTLRALCERVSAAANLRINSVLCNLYRDGRDSMGMHSDSEPELGHDPVIASLSLGATRRFQLRHRQRPAEGKLDLALTDGSLLVMRGTTQRFYRHGVPKEPRVNEPRINLTFRCVTPRGA